MKTKIFNKMGCITLLSAVGILAILAILFSIFGPGVYNYLPKNVISILPYIALSLAFVGVLSFIISSSTSDEEKK